MKNVKAYSIQMSLDVPDSEKRVAEKAGELFEYALAQLKENLEHLNYIYVPFSTLQEFDPQEVSKQRSVFQRYRDQIKENYEKLFNTSYKAVSLMSEFSTDSTVEELMSSFISNLNDLKKSVNFLLSIFSNLDSADFKDGLISSINSVKTQSSQLKQLINDRVLEYIDTNILAKNWESLVNDQFQNKLKSKTPLIVELYKERKKALNS